MFVLGLTGDIGAGKSTVSAILGEMGAQVIDADKIVRWLWTQPSIIKRAKERWGSAVFHDDGTVNFHEVSEKVFKDETEYKWLCALLHPGVRAEIGKKISQSRGWLVVEIPLLFESGIPYWCDSTLYVRASMPVRVSRNSERGLNEVEIARRSSYLLPEETKAKMADIVIENSGSIEELRGKIVPLGREMLRMSSVCSVKVQCGFRRQAKEIISNVLKNKLAYQANLVSTETSYGNYDQFLTDNWEITFYSLMELVESLSQEVSNSLNKEAYPVVACEICKVPTVFRKKICEACL